MFLPDFVHVGEGGLIEILQGVILRYVSTLIETYVTDMVRAGLMSTMTSLENIQAYTVKF